MITHGSQQALDLTGKVFLEEGDVVLCESPTYLAAISAFRAYGCRFAEVETDEDGMVISRLEKALEENPGAKLIYIVPDFQNPTGRTGAWQEGVSLPSFRQNITLWSLKTILMGSYGMKEISCPL